MELGVLAQEEGDGLAIGADVETLRQLAPDAVKVKDPFAINLLASHRYKAIIGAETQAKCLSGRARHGRVQRVDGGPGHVAQGLCPCLRLCRQSARHRHYKAGCSKDGLEKGPVHVSSLLSWREMRRCLVTSISRSHQRAQCASKCRSRNNALINRKSNYNANACHAWLLSEAAGIVWSTACGTL